MIKKIRHYITNNFRNIVVTILVSIFFVYCILPLLVSLKLVKTLLLEGSFKTFVGLTAIISIIIILSYNNVKSFCQRYKNTRELANPSPAYLDFIFIFFGSSSLLTYLSCENFIAEISLNSRCFFAFNIILVFVWFLLIYFRKPKEVNSTKPLTGVDDPLANPSEDCLDRDNFAKKIFTLIDTSPLDSHLRVGILGDWGSGKTTVMHFIKYYCQQKEHPVAMFHPWQFHSREDAWKGFVASIDKGLAIWKSLPVGNFKRKRIIKDISGKARKLAKIANTKIGKAIGELILSPLENMLEETKVNISEDLKNILNDKRLYVFIDDLDRAEPEIVYDMLMLLNEVFDINQCIFVIGLDTKTISDVLKNKLGYINSKDFLEKIINWPFELPVPSRFEWATLLEKELSSTASELVKNAVTSIVEIIPKNPRKFKHYLRYLNSLHKGFLSRFGKNELDWKMLYLAQLLRMEFPEIFRELMHDNDIVDDIATGVLKDADDATSDFGTDKREDDLKWKKKIEEKIKKFEDINRDRFFEIYKALRDCGGFNSTPERVRNHLLVIEDPGLMTWSEYSELKDNLSSHDNTGVTVELKEFISKNQENKKIERVREFIKMLLRDREHVWSCLIELDTQDEMKIQIQEINKLMRICNLLIEIDEIFTGANPIFDKATFEEWYEYLSKNSYFNEPKDLYQSIREGERELLLKVIHKNIHRASEISEWLLGKMRETDMLGQSINFAETKKEILEILDKKLADDLLKRFESVGGMKGFWSSDSFESEKKIIMKDDSFFHKADSYNKLKKISEKARNNIQIQSNFVETLRMLCYGANNRIDWTTQTEVQQLIKKKEFFNIIWSAAVCRPLNRRLVGTLEGYIKPLVTIVNDESYFERPEWWKALIADILE